MVINIYIVIGICNKVSVQSQKHLRIRSFGFQIEKIYNIVFLFRYFICFQCGRIVFHIL